MIEIFGVSGPKIDKVIAFASSPRKGYNERTGKKERNLQIFKFEHKKSPVNRKR